MKDQANECELFRPRVTVARDATHGSSSGVAPASQASNANLAVPRNASDARAAFDNLFRKTTD